MLVSIVIAILVLALLGWVLSVIPMDGQYKQGLYVILVVAIALYLISLLVGMPVRVVG